MNKLEQNIKEWREFYSSKGGMKKQDLDELEDHLREEISELKEKSLSDQESFIIAVKRLGKVESLSNEYRKVNTHNLWKILISESEDPEEKASSRKNLLLAISLTIAAALLVELPKLFGITLEAESIFYLKNLSFFLLPLIAILFFYKKESSLINRLAIIGVFVLALLLINIYPFREPFHTANLSILHLPLFLWFFCGLAYTGRDWKKYEEWMDFLRFTGELFIYTVLLIGGVFVVTGVIMLLFEAIDINVENIVPEYFSFPVAVSMPVLASYLVNEKKSVVENLAPILARIFAPVFLVVLLIFMSSMIFLQKSPFLEREFLIGFDLMLVLVLGIVFYVLSTRDPNQAPKFYDWISLVLIITALAVDIVALSAILFRLQAFGISPNKTAALGENILIFIHLFGTGFLFIQFFRGKVNFSRIEKWQTGFLPVFALWLGIVALVFPLIFKFS
ncbi:MAG TPA: hypothetical protein VKP78_09200 [bacterium]|nr:hypothetical protein [bacterium]